MPTTLKTTLLAGAIALAAAFGATQAAQAGGRHHIPFGPFNSYLPGAYDGGEDYGYGDYDDDDDRRYGTRRDTDDAVTDALDTASRYIGVDLADRYYGD